MLRGKVLVAQGGGPTAVINESMVGTVIEARKFAGVEQVYGAFHGVQGIVNEDFLDLAARPTLTWNWSPRRRAPRWAPPATGPTSPIARRSSRS